MYKIIDKNLRLAGCGLADLSAEQVDEFLHGWEEGAKIGDLTLFYDSRENLLVLNQDNADYESYLFLAQKFLAADKEKRLAVMDNAPDGTKETIQVLDRAAEIMYYREELNRVRSIITADEQRKCVGYIVRKMGNSTAGIYAVFRYGVMCGKRWERARRKAAKHE